MRIVKEMRESTNGEYPKYMVWENVPGAFSSNHGEDFRTVLNEIVSITEDQPPPVPMPEKGRWPKSGCLYDNMGAWSIAWGVPQRRKRIALVTDFRGLTAPEVLFERESVSRNPKESREEREEASQNTRRNIIHTISPQELKLKNQYVFDARGNGKGNVVPTITGDHQNRVTDYTALCVGNSQLNQQQAIIQNRVVRRLTPLECERLQGYPDNWTDIGEWVDSKGKKRKSSDTGRYKALGNSIALPFWSWLLGRISERCGTSPTLGSLFDGLGGFPLCWETHNGEGSAVWASEIEEFPIAVTKCRFSEPSTE